jgi:hypothetical protein
MPLNKPINQLTEADLQELIANGVAERRDIEYKRELPGTNDEAKKEFLGDVSSFSNTIGGQIIFGIEESEGLPVALPGFVEQDFDAVKQRLESLLQTGVAPRIPGIELSDRITMSCGTSALAIRIPRSWNGPHMVSFRGRSAFYGRTSAGKYQLDVEQLRSAFALSQSARDKIRDFRAGRIAQIVAGETPVKLVRIPAAVVHVLPLASFETDRRFGSRELEAAFAKGKTMPVYSEQAWNFQFNFDGLAIYDFVSQQQEVASYLQVFRNGVIESVSTELMASDRFVLLAHSSRENFFSRCRTI